MRGNKKMMVSYLAKFLKAAECGLIQSGTRELLAHFSMMVLWIRSLT